MALTKVNRGGLNTGGTDASDATAITINSSENVGIGETSPTSKLHVKDGAGANIAIQSTAGSHWRLGDAVGTSNGYFVIYDYTNSAGRLVIDSSGRIVCGRAAPISSGGVSSDHTFEQLTDARWAIATHSDKTNNYGIAPYYATAHDGTGNHFLNCTDTGANRLKIRSDGDVQNHDNSYGSTSDERIKQDIKDANSQWDDIKALKIRNYKKKDDVRQYKDKAWEQIGVIAQELEASGMNKLVSEGEPCEHDIKSSAEFGTLNEDGTIKEVKSKVKDVKYSVLYMKAVKALQEAMARIETLETKVAALEAK